jgi:hypothetical protein
VFWESCDGWDERVKRDDPNFCNAKETNGSCRLYSAESEFYPEWDADPYLAYSMVLK